MNETPWLAIVTLSLVLILPLSALLQRKLPVKRWVALISSWIVLFAVAALVFTQIGFQ